MLCAVPLSRALRAFPEHPTLSCFPCPEPGRCLCSLSLESAFPLPFPRGQSMGCTPVPPGHCDGLGWGCLPQTALCPVPLLLSAFGVGSARWTSPKGALGDGVRGWNCSRLSLG